MNALTRRDLLRLSAAATGGALLTACSGAPSSSTTSSSSKTLNVYWGAGHNYKAYQKVFKDFEAKHGVKVNVQLFKADLRTRVTADLAAGSVPDIIEEPTGWVREFAPSGDALSLQKYADRDAAATGFPADWQPRAVERNTYDGQLYGVQLHLTDILPVYNVEMFEAAGIKEFPTTWEELIDVAKKLTKGDVYGLALNQEPEYAYGLFLQNGVKWFDPATKQVLAPADKAIETLQFMGDLIHKHKLARIPTAQAEAQEPQKLFAGGQAAIIFTGPWDIGPIRTANPDLKFAIAPAMSRVQQATSAAGASVFIPAKAKNPDLAWELIKELTSLETEKAATAEAGMLMPRKSWGEAAEVRANPIVEAYSQTLGYAADFTLEARSAGKQGKLYDPLKSLYHGVIMQNKPAAQAYEEFQAAIKPLLTS